MELELEKYVLQLKKLSKLSTLSVNLFITFSVITISCSCVRVKYYRNNILDKVAL